MQSNLIKLNQATLDALENITVTTNQKGRVLNYNNYSFTALAANTPIMLLDPANNPNGFEVLDAFISYAPMVRYIGCTMLMNISIPVNWTDGVPLLIAVGKDVNINSTTSTIYGEARLERNIFVPANHGVWLVAGINEGAATVKNLWGIKYL